MANINYGSSTFNQMPLATAKISKIMGLYPKTAPSYIVCYTWLALAKRNGFAPNAGDIADFIGSTKAEISLILRKINSDLLHIGLKPLRAY